MVNNIRLHERPKRTDVDGDVLPAIDVKSQPVYILAESLGFPYLRYDCPYEDGDEEETLITVIPGTERAWKNAIMRIYRQGHPHELHTVISALASMKREAQRKEDAK